MVGGIANPNVNPNGNGNVVAARDKGNGNGNNGNQIRCYNCTGLGHYAKNYTFRPRRRDVAYLQTQDIDEIKEVNANCILMANLQQASTSGTQTDKAIVYDSGETVEVHHNENCYNNDIFNMFTQEEQYTEPLDPISEPYTVQQNNSNVISVESSMEHTGEIVEQHPATVEETHAYFESLYNNLAIKFEKVNMVNRKMKETNADLTTKLAKYRGQEKSFEINKAKFDELETGYRKSVYQEQCLTIKINALHLSFAIQITALNEEIANLNNQLSKEKSTVSLLQEEKKKLKSDFKTREDEFLDKQIQYEKTIKELDNILVKMGQSIQTMHMLSPKPDSFYHTEQKMALGYQNPFYLKQAQQKQHSLYNGKILLEKHDPPTVYDSEETLQLSQESRLKMKQLNKEIKLENYVKINKLFEVFVSQKAKSREEKADESLDKITVLKKENECLLRTVASQDIMFIMQSPSIVETSDLQTELERTKEWFENYTIKKENEYAKLWNDWYKKCEEYTLDPLSQKLEDENVSLKFQVPPKVVVSNDLSNPVTSNSVPNTHESKVGKNNNVIAPRMFKINPFKTSREDKFMSINKARASIRTNSITVSQPHVITKNDVNSDSNGFSSTRVDNTAKTRRPQPRSNTKNDRVLSVSKSSCIKNKDVEVEEHHRNLLLSKNKKHMSSECNNIKLAIWNDKFEVVCAMCKQCLITCNHDVCVLNYVNDMNFRADNQNANVSNTANQKKHTLNIKKTMKVGYKERLASPKPRKPRTCLRWSPTGRFFDLKGKLINDRDDIRKLGAKGDIGFFIGYSANSCSYKVYNRRKRKIMEMVNVTFDELSTMDFEQRSSKPRLQGMTSRQISSGLDLTYATSTNISKTN
ncbi:hypothetical protein Tco_1251157 [Tanacetum coccineum]